MRPFTLDRLERLHRTLNGRAWIRHDVDACLDAALHMAVWENTREIHSTYFLMSTSPWYSWSDACELGGKLLQLGHRVGYHWDTREPWPAFIEPDPEMLVSFHCPEPHLLWRDFRAFTSAYAAEWKGAYYADSRGRFSHGDPEDHQGDWPIQVNLHPEHWFHPSYLADLGVTPAQYEIFWREPMEQRA